MLARVSTLLEFSLCDFVLLSTARFERGFVIFIIRGIVP